MNQNKKIAIGLLFGVVGAVSFFSAESKYLNLDVFAKEAQSRNSKLQQQTGPLITYESEQVGDREKLKVTVKVEDRSGIGIKEFRDHTGKLINGNSYTFEITMRGNYTFSAIDNNNQESSIKIDDFWVNPITANFNGRRTNESGYWPTSSLREWLNSGKAHVDYTCNPPSVQLVGNENAYNEENGFLYDFTKDELDAIAVTRRRVQVSDIDRRVAADGNKGGWTRHINPYAKTFMSSCEYYVKKYNELPYKEENDKMFILSAHEYYWYILRRGFNIEKDFTEAVKLKHNLGKNNKGWWLQNNSDWKGIDRITVANINSNFAQMIYNNKASGVVPAFHLKKEYLFKDGRRATDLSIGDKIFFGSYLGEAIEWEVINVTNSGYPLLCSTKSIDYKIFDTPGDQSRKYSDYIDYKNVDVSLIDDIEYNSTKMSSDRDIPTISIKNEEPLLVRQNGAYSVDFEINDDSGIEYIQVNSENKIYSSKFSYTFTKNGSNVISAMDNAGNLAEFYIPVTNINESPVVSLSNSSDGAWTSSNVYIDVSTSHDVIYRHPDSVYSSRTGLGGKYFPNYFNYSQSKFRVSGKMKLNSQLGTGIGDKSYLIPSLGYNRKWLTDDGYFSDVLYIGPKDSEYIKVKDLSSVEFTDFEYEITIPKNYSHNLHALMDTKNVGVLGDSHLEIELKDLTYELINDDEDSGFEIKSIELPNGKIVNQNKYTDVIEEEGIYSNLEYKILDSRGKETIKRTSVKIDKTAPELNLIYNKDELVNNKSTTINIAASDSLSGVKRIRLPNGNYINSDKATYDINGSGDYVFECEDLAGNITSKAISINGDNSNLSTEVNKSDNWTNRGVQINIDLRK